MAEPGETDDGRLGCCGMGDFPFSEYPSSSSEPLDLCVAMETRDARIAAVAASDSSMVPVWWFWCLVRVVRRVKVFWQSAYGHLYGLLPEWILRWRANELLSLKGCEVVSCCIGRRSAWERGNAPCHIARTCEASRRCVRENARSRRCAG
jgi:hypothetical protein